MMTDVAHSPMLTSALAYAEGALRVFPLHSITLAGQCTCGQADCKSPGKHPRTTHGVDDATCDPDQIARWWERWPNANIGVATGAPGLFVVDIDGDRGAESWRNLCDAHGGEPATRSVRTGNGRHLWFVTDDDSLPSSTSRMAPGVDTRGRGGYVVAPPSVHAAGGGTLYAWENPGSPLARLPEWIATLALQPEQPAAPGQAGVTAGDAVARKRLSACAGQVAIAQEGERNSVLNWAAFTLGRLVGAGRLAEEEVRSALITAATRAGLGEREAQRTIGSGLGAGSKNPDYDALNSVPQIAPLTTPTPTEAGDPKQPSALLTAALTKIETGAQFILDTDHQIEPLWGGDNEVLWARGEPFILTGPTGVGKTTVAHQLLERLLGLSTRPLFDLPVATEVNKVLYLACDRPNQIRRAFARRFNELHRSDLRDRLAVHNGYLPAMVDQHPGLLAELVTHLEADVLVIDSLKDVASELEKGPNAIAINQSLQHVCQSGCDVIVLHHQRKSQGDNKRPKTIDDLYGNTLIPSGAGSVALIWGAPGDLAVELHHLKKPAEEVGPLKLLHDHSVGETRINEAERVDLVELAGRHKDGLTVAAAAAALYGTALTGRTTAITSDREKARYRLEKLVNGGLLNRGIPGVDGAARYVVNGVPGRVQMPGVD